MERPLDDILSDNTDEAPAETVVTTEPESIVDPPSGILRDEKGRFAPKEEKGVETAAEPEQAAEPVPPTEQSQQLPKEEFAALKDERRKRQELERRLAAIEQQTRAPEPPRADFWDDPQQFMGQFGEQLLQQWEQRQQIQRIDASEQAARARHNDYDEAYAVFEQAVRLNPSLAYELAQASDPGEFAYAKGRAAMAIQSVGSLDELRAQIRAELEAEARAVVQPRQTLSLPSTTAADGSVGGRSGPEWSGPKPLGQILG